MKFNDYEYVRPDYDKIREQYLSLINDFKIQQPLTSNIYSLKK